MPTNDSLPSYSVSRIRYVESSEWRSNLEYTLCAAFNIPNEEAELELTVGMNSEFVRSLMYG